MKDKQKAMCFILLVFLVPVLVLLLWYPKTGFELKQEGKSIYMPDTIVDPYGFRFEFREYGVSSYYVWVSTRFFSDRYINEDTGKYIKKLYIKEIKYTWEGGTGVLVKDYVTDGLDLTPSSKMDNWWLDTVDCMPDINFHKIFKGKKSGAEFYCAFHLTYNLDDGPEILQIINYHVTVYKDNLRLHISFVGT